MNILNTVSLESNTQIKINFDGGDLSSDAGLLPVQEFLSKTGATNLIHRIFRTNDSAQFRIHIDDANLVQYYCGRGNMVNFIKEGKNGFDFASVSSSFKPVNENRFLIHTPAYNLFNWFRKVALAAKELCINNLCRRLKCVNMFLWMLTQKRE